MRQAPEGSADHSEGRVTQMSMSATGKANPAGNTPMIVYDTSSSAVDLPTTCGSPLNRRRHSSLLIIAAAGPPCLSSSGRKLRPSTGSTPRIFRKLAETRPAFTTSGSPLPESVRFSSGPMAPNLLNE